MSTMIDADAARREGFVPLGASRKGSSFRGGRAAANDTAAEIGSLGKGHKSVWKTNRAPHAIDATCFPWLRLRDGVEAHEGPRNTSLR